MPNTPKVPRPPVVDGEASGLTANEMQSLMHSEDRASGFGTKGHIDLRELDADPSSDAAADRPRAPALPSDADEYPREPDPSSRTGVIFGALGLAVVGAAVAYFVMESSGGATEVPTSNLLEVNAQQTPETFIGGPNEEVAEKPIQEPTSEQPTSEQPTSEQPTSEHQSPQPADSTQSAQTATVSEGAAAAKTTFTEVRRSVRTQPKRTGSASPPAEPEQSEGIDADDIARRAAAVQGQNTTLDDQQDGESSEPSVGGAVDDADKPKSAESIDELLDTATGSSDEFEKTKPEPPPSGDTPSKAGISKVMGALMPGFRSCAGDQAGVVTALVALKSSGDVVSARVSGSPFGGTRQGTCMEDVIKRRAKFGSFKQTRFEFRYPIRINP